MPEVANDMKVRFNVFRTANLPADLVDGSVCGSVYDYLLLYLNFNM